MLITLSAAAIRARIQSLIALRATLSAESGEVLTPDRNFALNQQLAFHFLSAMLRLAPSVADYSLEPTDFYENPDCELMLQAEFKPVAGSDPKKIRGCLENYIAMMTLATLLGESSARVEESLYLQQAREELEGLAEYAAVTVPVGLRVSRTI